MFPPEKIIIRPPVEARSVLIPVTGGCSWNLCRFCGVYKGIQNYTICPLEKVFEDIEKSATYYPNAPHIYLAGGNPTSAPTDYLVKILNKVYNTFRDPRRVSCYAKVLDILRKSEDDMGKLAEAGLSIVYMGMESGSNTVLKYMKKGHIARTLIEASKKIMKAGIQLSLYIILGLGGKKWTEEHAKETARVLNQIEPDIFRFRTLNVMDNSPLKKDIESGDFEIVPPLGILKEQKMIIENLDKGLSSSMKNDHVSNYTFIQSSHVGSDKEKLLKQLDELVDDPRVAEWKHKGLKRM